MLWGVVQNFRWCNIFRLRDIRVLLSISHEILKSVFILQFTNSVNNVNLIKICVVSFLVNLLSKKIITDAFTTRIFFQFHNGVFFYKMDHAIQFCIPFVSHKFLRDIFFLKERIARRTMGRHWIVQLQKCLCCFDIWAIVKEKTCTLFVALRRQLWHHAQKSKFSMFEIYIKVFLLSYGRHEFSVIYMHEFAIVKLK